MIKTRIIFLFFLILPNWCLAQNDYLKNLIGKTPAQISTVQDFVTNLDSAMFSSVWGVHLANMTTAILARGIQVDDYASLASAINAAESDTNVVIVSKNTKSIGTDTLRRTAQLFVYRGGRISVNSGATFLIQGSFVAGNYKVFEGSGTVKFDEGSVDFVNPYWFGAVGDSSTASVTGIQKAVDSGAGKRITVKFPPGTYLINDKITLTYSNTTLIGDQATIVSSDTNDYVFRCGPLKTNIKVSGFTIRYNPRATTVQPNISVFFFNEIDTLELTHNRVLFATGMGMQLAAVKNAKISFNHIENTLRDGIHITNGFNSDTGRNIWSENVIITNNTVRNATDDKIAIAGYKRPLGGIYGAWTGSQEINRRIVIANNIVEGGNSSANARGITCIGAQDVIIDGNTIRGFTGGKMTSGILVDRISDLNGFRNKNVVVSNNVIVDGQYTSFVDNFGGIKLGGVDSVIVIGNYIKWTQYTYGIRVRCDTVGEDFFTNGTRDAIIANNIIQDARIGISLLAISNTGQWNERITIDNNIISNSQRNAISADSVKGIYVTNNKINGINLSGTGSIRAIRLNRVDQDVVVRNNILRSTTSVEYAVSITNAKSTADMREEGNVYNIGTTVSKILFNSNASAAKYFSQDTFRVHYATAAPTDGTWAKGDITINRNPDNGDISMWFCTTAGNPGTWTQSTATINGLSVNDTTGAVVLDANGAATVTGFSNVILDTKNAQAHDTLTTLTGRIGQIVYISPRANTRNITLLDSDNFRLPSASVRLDSTEDVLCLKATTTTSWKMVSLKTRRGLRGSEGFSGTATTDTVTVANGLSTDLYFIQLTGAAAPSANDMHRVEALNGSFVVHRSAAGTSGLTYNWRRERK